MQLPSVRTGENKLRPLLLPTADSNARAQGRPVQIYLREGGTKESARPTSKSCLVSKGASAIKGSRGSG